MNGPDRAGLIADYPFPLDRFQLDALDAVDAGRHVVVAAPTGSGKTVVAEYAIAQCLGRKERVIYTSPIKVSPFELYSALQSVLF